MIRDAGDRESGYCNREDLNENGNAQDHSDLIRWMQAGDVAGQFYLACHRCRSTLGSTAACRSWP